MTTSGALLTAVALLAVSAGSACSGPDGGPPRIEEDRTACAHCGMLISERAYAAAYKAPRAEARVFDDIGCLLTAARREADRAGLQYWFHDASSRAWIDGPRAVFIQSPDLKTPMSGGIVAYGDGAVAAREAAARKARVISSLDELLQNTAGGS